MTYNSSPLKFRSILSYPDQWAKDITSRLIEHFPLFPFLKKLPNEDQRTYLIDVISAAYYGVFLGFVNPFVPVILKRLGASPFQVGLSLAAPFLALLVSYPLMKYMKNYKAIDLVTLPALFSRLSAGLLGIFASPSAILVVFLFIHFVEGFGLPAFSRVLRDMYSERGRSLAMGYVRTILGIFLILSSAIGGKLLDSGHSLFLFVCAGLCGAISAVNFRRIFPDYASSPILAVRNMEFSDIIRTNRESESFFWLNITVVLYGFGNLLMFGVLPTLLVEKFDISNKHLGLLSSLTSFTQVVGYYVFGKYVSKHGPQKGLLIGLLIGTAIPWLILFSTSINGLILPYLLMGVMFAGFDLCWFLLVLLYAPKDEVSIYASVYTFLLGLRGVIATMISNLALPVVGAATFLYLGGIFNLLGLLIGYLKRDKWRAGDYT